MRLLASYKYDDFMKEVRRIIGKFNDDLRSLQPNQWIMADYIQALSLELFQLSELMPRFKAWCTGVVKSDNGSNWIELVVIVADDLKPNEALSSLFIIPDSIPLLTLTDVYTTDGSVRGFNTQNNSGYQEKESPEIVFPVEPGTRKADEKPRKPYKKIRNPRRLGRIWTKESYSAAVTVISEMTKKYTDILPGHLLEILSQQILYPELFLSNGQQTKRTFKLKEPYVGHALLAVRVDLSDMFNYSQYVGERLLCYDTEDTIFVKYQHVRCVGFEEKVGRSATALTPLGKFFWRILNGTEPKKNYRRGFVEDDFEGDMINTVPIGPNLEKNPKIPPVGNTPKEKIKITVCPTKLPGTEKKPDPIPVPEIPREVQAEILTAQYAEKVILHNEEATLLGMHCHDCTNFKDGFCIFHRVKRRDMDYCCPYLNKPNTEEQKTTDDTPAELDRICYNCKKWFSGNNPGNLTPVSRSCPVKGRMVRPGDTCPKFIQVIIRKK